jgi:DNA polymerase-3 subunit delta
MGEGEYMLYILYGADDFSLKLKLGELEVELGDMSSREFNRVTFNARELIPAELVSACSTLPFLGQKRMVMVEGLLGHLDSLSKTPDEWKFLPDFVKRMPESTILVLVDGNIKKDNLMLKKLSSQAVVENFSPLRGSKLQEWIRQRVKERDGEISSQAAGLLTALAGDNLWVLSHELDKLLLYTGGRRVEAGDVRRLTNYVREVTIFATVDAIIERRGATALQMVHRLLEEGASVSYILTMITRQLRLMIQLKDMDVRRLGEDSLRRELGVSPAYPLSKLWRQAAGYSVERLVDMYEKLLEVDIAIKTGKWRAELAADLLVAELCS